MTDKNYRLLPFNFKRFESHVLLTNDAGEYYFLPHGEFDSLVSYGLTKGYRFYDLEARGFVCDGFLAETIENLADKYRTKKRFLYDFTNLHMMVLTYRCNHDCRYCHASSVADTCLNTPDMSLEVARKCVDIALQSPSRDLKLEFQGGEPLLNFEALKFVVKYANERIKDGLDKNLEFVVCTNLTLLTEEHLRFFEEHNVLISTSFDGPMECHDANRILRNGQSSYQHFTQKLGMIRDPQMRNSVSALLTVTRQNIHRLPEVVDEYVKVGFCGVFLRMLNRIGPAQDDWDEIGYEVDAFVAAYRKTLDYIIELNLSGTYFPEILASILLTKILTPFSTGFVDLQSPAGMGIAGVIYDTDGAVFASDEGRMLARATGDTTFKIGDVHTEKWKTIFGGHRLRDIVSRTVIESQPACWYCAYQPYCGSDPVKNYLATGRVDGLCQDNCRKYKAIFNILFEYLQADRREVQDVLWSWVTGKKVED